jgi:hypothetical protein
MNLTVAEARDRIASAAGLCASDARVLSYLNRAIRRLLPKGKWKGTYMTFQICVNSDCITWPRQIGTIEAVNVCSKPIAVRNSWYEFLEAGPGTQNGNSGLKHLDRGEHCAFDDITASALDRKIRVYADVTEGAGKTIILQGYDQYGIWIRTQDAGVWIDGEKVAIPATTAGPSVSTKVFSKLVRVIKAETNGAIRLYEYNTTDAVNVRPLAFYEPDETLPSYRRSYLPGLSRVHSNGDCERAQVEVVAKLRFYPVSGENDFLLIANLDALEEETRALVHFDNRNFAEGYTAEKFAVSLLNDELSQYLGDGPVLMLRVESGDFGAGSVENAV